MSHFNPTRLTSCRPYMFETPKLIVCFIGSFMRISTLATLKAKKTHGFNSCIVISVYPLDILSIEKATEYRND